MGTAVGRRRGPGAMMPRAGWCLWALMLCATVVVAEPGRAAPKSLLPAPQWVSAYDVRGKAQLTWVRSAVFAAVRVYRREDAPGSVLLPLAATRENTWVDDTVQPGRMYRYRLAGLDAEGREGPPSGELAVRISVPALRPATTPQWDGYLPLTDGVGLKWTAREDEDVIAWNIYRRSPPETVFQLVGSTRRTSYTDAGLTPGRLYVYVLTALDSSFRETPFSAELFVTIAPAPAGPKTPAAAEGWAVRRSRVVALVGGGKDIPFLRPADVVVGPVTGNVYVSDSGRNVVFVFTPLGSLLGMIGAGADGIGSFRNVLGLGVDRDEYLYVVDAGRGAVQIFTPQGRPAGQLPLSFPGSGATGLIDAAVGADGKTYVVDNFNSRVAVAGPLSDPRGLGQPGGGPGELSAPTFCAVDAAGSFYVADGLNARVQVFSAGGEFVRAFGRPEWGPGGFGRPKGIAVSSRGEVYVADSWLNTVQVFDAEGRFVALLADESGRPLDLGSPNGVALGEGNRVYVAERLAARLQVLELIDAP